MNVNARLAVVAFLLTLATATRATAQYAEVPRPLPVSGSDAASGTHIGAATQIGRRLFVGGNFTLLSPPLGGAVVLDPSGAVVPGGFPLFTGAVRQIVADGRGGWFVVGDFTSAEGRPVARFARVRPDRHVDPAFTVDVDDVIGLVAVAHGRVYLAGTFRFVNGQRRGGLAALSADTGALTTWASDFDMGGRVPRALAASSIGVYVAAGPSVEPALPGRIWGLEAGRGTSLFARTVDARALVATSSRVYVGGYGYVRPVWAIDPATGADHDWALGFPFVPLGSSAEPTEVTTLLLDGDRLYIGGYLRAEDGQEAVLVADAGTGARVRWTPQLPRLGAMNITRIGPAIVVASTAHAPIALDPATAATFAFHPPIHSGLTAAATPEGVVVGGEAFWGTASHHSGLASIDLDTWTLEAWTTSLTTPQLTGVRDLDTDGAWLIVRLNDGRIAKVDPATGVVLGEHSFSGAFGVPARVNGGAVYVVHPQGVLDATWKVSVITIADWSIRTLPIDIPRGQPHSVDVDGDTIYVAGGFDLVNGASRPGLAAVSLSTGALLPFRPAPDDAFNIRVRAAGGRVWAAGSFRRIGGAWRRGLAELDPATGAALPWNPDLPGIDDGVLDIGPDGDLFVGSGANATLFPRRAAGQLASPSVAYATATGQRRPWRHREARLVAVLPDCVIVENGCLPRAIAPPDNLLVTVTGATLSMQWTVPPATTRTGLRLEFGSSEGRADLHSLDLPPTQTTFTAAGVPPGRYVARLRSLDGAIVGPPSDDVSFAVGAAMTAAPLSATAAVEGSQVTFAWRPPSTGAPQAYRLAVGSAPGLANLATLPIDGQATSFQVTAPPGRYWARLYAASGGNTSSPTPDLYIAAAATDVFLCGTVFPPEHVAASVSGNVVTITWQAPSFGMPAAAYRILAGSAPGLEDLATETVGDVTSFTAAAPPGRYYVSMVAFDACGTTSVASAPVTVVVP